MNPIDALRIKMWINARRIKNYEIKENGLVDIERGGDEGNSTVLFLDILRKMYHITDKSFEIPFKIETTKIIEIISSIDNYFTPDIMKNLKNLPNLTQELYISPSIVIESLEGLNCVRNSIFINLKNQEKYKRKEDVLKNYPNLRIGNLMWLRDLKQYIPFNDTI